jgi:hypothetical protein
MCNDVTLARFKNCWQSAGCLDGRVEYYNYLHRKSVIHFCAIFAVTPEVPHRSLRSEVAAHVVTDAHQVLHLWTLSLCGTNNVSVESESTVMHALIVVFCIQVSIRQ